MVSISNEEVRNMISDGIWVFSPEIERYDLKKEFKVGKVEGWKDVKKKGKKGGGEKVSEELVVFMQKGMRSAEKNFLYGIGEIVDTNFKGVSYQKGVRVRYRYKFSKPIFMEDLQRKSNLPKPNYRGKRSKLQQMIYTGFAQTDSWLDETDFEPLVNIVPELRQYIEMSERGNVAIDIEPPAPERVKAETYRIIRDTKLSKSLKNDHDFHCQICNPKIEIIEVKGKGYAESHHLKPLGEPHNGPDDKANIIVLCPNHHVMFDYGEITIDPKDNITVINSNGIPIEKITSVPSHTIGKKYIQYHYDHIFRK